MTVGVGELTEKKLCIEQSADPSLSTGKVLSDKSNTSSHDITESGVKIEETVEPAATSPEKVEQPKNDYFR